MDVLELLGCPYNDKGVASMHGSIWSRIEFEIRIQDARH